MSEIYNRGDILVSRDKDKPNLRILRVDNFEDEKEEFRLVKIDESKLKEFKLKTTDETTFILQIFGRNNILKRDDIQNLFKSNFIFDYDLYTFNTRLSDNAICVIQLLSKAKEDEPPFKIIITNKQRDTQASGIFSNIDECLHYIELYLIRNKPSLSFDYFKENLEKYKKEISKNTPPVETTTTEKEEVEEVNENHDVDSTEKLDEFFSDISPDPLSKEEKDKMNKQEKEQS